MINNNILDRKHFEAEDAGETERAVYAAYLEYKQGVYDKLNYELTEGGTPYNKLSKQYRKSLKRRRRDHEGTCR